MDLRTAIASLSPVARARLQAARDIGASYCVAVGDVYIVGVNISEHVCTILETKNEWSLGTTEV